MNMMITEPTHHCSDRAMVTRMKTRVAAGFAAGLMLGGGALLSLPSHASTSSPTQAAHVDRQHARIVALRAKVASQHRQIVGYQNAFSALNGLAFSWVSGDAAQPGAVIGSKQAGTALLAALTVAGK